MKKESKLVASKKMTPLLTVNLSDLDNKRALCALMTIEGQFKTDYFILRDAVEKIHDATVYYTNGAVTYSHQRHENIVTFYQEEYELVQDTSL